MTNRNFYYNVSVTNWATGEVLEKRAKRGEEIEAARELIQLFRDEAPSSFDERRVEVVITWGLRFPFRWLDVLRLNPGSCATCTTSPHKRSKVCAIWLLTSPQFCGII